MLTYEEAVARLERVNPEALVRRWGFEIESPIIGQVKSDSDWRDYEGLAFCSDGSLSGSECECECSDCYHSCNCDNCERADYLDHCGDCEQNELSCSDPMNTATLDRWSKFLDKLQRDWSPVENWGENWGGHIHVEARDLTKRQSANVVIAGERLFQIAPDWFTGGRDDYNEPLDRRHVEGFARDEIGGYNTNRASWISIHNLRASEPQPYQPGDRFDNTKSTIEFRAFRSTADRKLIEFRALVARALVEYCRKGGQIYWLTSAQDFGKFLKVLGI
jgi:hypothetical protein